MERERHWLEQAFLEPGVTISVRTLTSLRAKCLNVADAAAASLVDWEATTTIKAGWYDEAFMRGSVALIMSAFALEAAINEAATLLRISDDVAARLERHGNPLDKAEALARLCGFPKVIKGSATGQAARLLFKLRNGLAHGRSEWSDEEKTHSSLSQEVIRHKLPLSRFVGPKDRPFPIGCMSGGTATWAVNTAREYIREYYTGAGIS